MDIPYRYHMQTTLYWSAWAGASRTKPNTDIIQKTNSQLSGQGLEPEISVLFVHDLLVKITTHSNHIGYAETVRYTTCIIRATGTHTVCTYTD